MGRGFGRGAKEVAIVTHAQVRKKTTKMPRGLRGSKKQKIERRRRAASTSEDPESMLSTRASTEARQNATAEALDAQIASIQFDENVAGRGRLKHLRKQLISQVKQLRRKHHEKRARRNARDRKNAAV